MENNLKEYRKRRSYTLQKLADCVGSSKSYIWELENKKSSPSLRISYAISRALGVNIADIFPDDQVYDQEIIKVVRRRVSK